MHTTIFDPTPGYSVNPLDPEHKAEWVRRLRSGYYEQGKGRLLLRSGARCCLGVFADLFPTQYPPFRDDVGSWFFEDKNAEQCGGLYTFTTMFYGPKLELSTNMTPKMVDTLPENIRGWYASWYDRSVAFFLSQANDEFDWTFSQIADWIEENL